MQTQAILERCKLMLFAGLCLILCAPAIALLFKLGKPPESAMQALAPKPSWASSSLPKYNADLELWITHHYPLRVELITAHSYLQHQWLKAPSPFVVVGSDTWLFFIGNNTTEDLVGRDRFSDAELKQWVNTMMARRAWLQKRGVRHLLVFAPNKSTVYPDKLPLLLQLQLKPGKLDQLVDALRRAGIGQDLVDLRPRLLKEKKTHTCYWPTDSHWNAEGLLAACDEIMLHVQALGISRPLPDYTSFYAIERSPGFGDCVSLLQMQGSWPRKEMSRVQILPPADYRRVETPLSSMPELNRVDPWVLPAAFEHDSGKGRVVLLCDSFMRVGGLTEKSMAQAPLGLNFKRFVSVWNWIGTSNLAHYSVFKAIVEQEHPDLIIEQIVERNLRTQPIDNPNYHESP